MSTTNAQRRLHGHPWFLLRHRVVQISPATRRPVAEHLHTEFEGSLPPNLTCGPDPGTGRLEDEQSKLLHADWAQNARNESEVRTLTDDGSSVKGSHLARLG